MTNSILAPGLTTATPELTWRDIPWGRNGLSVGIVVEPGDAAIYRELTSAAVETIAMLTTRLRQATDTIARLREELRRAHQERVA